jgi:hypothetical protein
MARIIPLKLNRNGKGRRQKREMPPTVADRVARLQEALEGLERLAKAKARGGEQLPSFMEFENAVKEKLDAVGRAATELFLTHAEERVAAACNDGLQCGERFLRPAPQLQPRNLSGRFGVLRYFRTYLRENHAGRRRGFHPLDVSLGLSADRFSWNVLSVSARMATKMSFVEARATVGLFLPNAPSTEVIEQTVLGLGKFTGDWFADLPAPEGDGEVLVVMIDSKGAPTATETELQRRRGKRRRKKPAPSPRHRGRHRRGLYPKKPRRKKGDKSKNAKMATLVVMYTLRRSGPLLLGPINRWIYGSFAPKEHAFQIARREADKRGFTAESGRLVQVVTDGDLDLDIYTKRYFPEATHTIDVMHVIEKLWTAGECVHPEGSRELKRWVDRQTKRLYAGNATRIVAELRRILEATPRTGPGNKGRRERLADVIRYIDKRLDRLNYHELLAQDLEIGSGAVEGAIKNVIGKRCDHGGMRWIKGRVEALLQLRCIEVNGHWDQFVAMVNDRFKYEGMASGVRRRLQADSPAPLPAVAKPIAEESGAERMPTSQPAISRKKAA